MSRKLTTYRRPSIADQLSSAKSVMELSRLRDAILAESKAGHISASGKTVRTWEEAMLRRIVELIVSARCARQATFIFNVVFRWFEDDEVREGLRELTRRTAARLPYMQEAAA